MLARYAGTELFAIARDFCAAASAAFAVADFVLGDRLVDQAEEILEFRAGAPVPPNRTDDLVGPLSPSS